MGNLELLTMTFILQEANIVGVFMDSDVHVRTYSEDTVNDSIVGIRIFTYDIDTERVINALLKRNVPEMDTALDCRRLDTPLNNAYLGNLGIIND